MAIKPILFNTEMVRAILDGRKTCTRRVVKPQPDEKHGYPIGIIQGSTEKKDIGCMAFGASEYGGSFQYAKAPYLPEDILYVRETWQYLYELDGNEQVIEDTGKYYYAATDTIPFDTYVDENGVGHDHAPWRPSIHMPKDAARIWLKVTDVRVERLQDMTDDDAEAEGCFDYTSTALGFPDVWESTIKESDLDRYGWQANPYVWKIEFERCKKPKEVEHERARNN
nr:MAG TPA: ASCH domain protein [Bacteriophage sp.]